MRRSPVEPKVWGSSTRSCFLSFSFCRYLFVCFVFGFLSFVSLLNLVKRNEDSVFYGSAIWRQFTVGKPELITIWPFSKQRTHGLTIVFLWLRYITVKIYGSLTKREDKTVVYWSSSLVFSAHNKRLPKFVLGEKQTLSSVLLVC